VNLVPERGRGGNPSASERREVQIFDITMAEIEAIAEPDCVGDDVGWESVALLGFHQGILPVEGI
jgi:hypothetical protein